MSHGSMEEPQYWAELKMIAFPGCRCAISRRTLSQGLPLSLHAPGGCCTHEQSSRPGPDGS